MKKHFEFSSELIGKTKSQKVLIRKIEDFVNHGCESSTIMLGISCHAKLSSFVTGVNRIDLNNAGFRCDRKDESVMRIYHTETPETSLTFLVKRKRS